MTARPATGSGASPWNGRGRRAEKVLAWAVHAYTALGLVLAAGIAVLVVRGTEDAFRLAFVLMAVATAIDSTDGWLARRFRVREALPAFEGRRLDDIVDFHTYTSLPLLLIWRSGLLPGALSWTLLFPLLASAYGFSRRDAKTEDGFFRGFPSYWNVVAFYLFFLGPPPWLSVAITLVLAGLTFVPSRYLNPSRAGPLSRVTIISGAVWGMLLLAFLAGLLEGRAWVLASLAFPAYYMIASWAITVRIRASAGPARREPSPGD